MLGAAVALWIAGFDFLYALFDEDIDRREGLHSIVTQFGVGGAFVGARLAHLATVVCLFAVGFGLPVDAFYWLGVAVVAALLGIRALARPARRPAAARRRLLHDERRDLGRVRRLRDSRHDDVTKEGRRLRAAPLIVSYSALRFEP